MSDVSQGPGWWQASDLKWYPPESHPNAQPVAPVATAQAPYGGGVGMAPPGAMVGGYGAPAAPWATANHPPIVSDGKRFGAFLLETLLALITLGIGWLLWSFLVWGKGQTPAKQVLGLRVIKQDTGQIATWGTMALRELVGKFILAIIPFYTIVSGFMILGTDTSQGLWDKVASTLVVDESKMRP